MVADGELGAAVGLERKVTAAELSHASGQTPLTDDDLIGLIPEHIETRGQLNEWEAENITLARRAIATRKGAFDVLSPEGLIELHHLMFGETWRWAGEYASSMNQFTDPRTPRSVQILQLVDDTREMLRTSTQSADDLDEITMRFHHRLTRIHPWRNGNGRHAREAADQLLLGQGRPRFTWGSGADLDAVSNVRTRYITGLKAADTGDYSQLRAFVRS